MLARILALPFMVILLGLAGLAMLLPAVHALILEDRATALAFGGSAGLTLVLFALVGLATAGTEPERAARSHLLALAAFYAALPLVLAVPFVQAVPDTTFLNAYVEMVSATTTTGATLFDEPGRLAPSVHLWRALVGWLGGFFAWVTAIAILAPLNLGGFEVRGQGVAGQGAIVAGQGGVTPTPITRVADPALRLQRFAARLFPTYTGLTLALWIGLIVAGDDGFVAFCHAMSVMATSGISPIGGLENAGSGMAGEALILLFFAFALSRLAFAPDAPGRRLSRLVSDPELRLGLFLIVAVTLALFLRHWAGAFEVDDEENLTLGLGTLWGGLFTVASFLTTTGFESAFWDEARDWSGLQTPGLILMGLALVGGGVATTAGGVKLLRVYALYMHGMREMERLVHPSSVGGSGALARHIRRQGAFVAWIFFMLFAISIAVVMAALALAGLGFDEALVFTLAALSTTGPLATAAAETPLSYAVLPGAAKLILSAAMVLGRLETLAVIALLNPDFWRR